MNSSNNENVEVNKEEVIETLDRINFWIGNCDTKVSFSLAFAGILLGGFFSSSIITGSLNLLIKKLIRMYSINNYGEVGMVLLTSFVLAMFFFFMALTITYLFKALKGSIDSSVYKQPGLTTDSISFFGTIAGQSFDSYKQKVMTATLLEKQNDLLSQVYINSKICQNKFKLYNNGLRYLVISTLLFAILNLFFLFIK
ncbi:hypothetical protein [Bacillus sp. Marseille-Q1617]|uniref:hypothetical protein n=1 Tax=Bacillus sp. Marseille-Q1617 TaxID=2736887 RepID=UPI00158E2ADB|nr:hypothetical protein [Bacillus sp. Marseille-Q1617]